MDMLTNRDLYVGMGHSNARATKAVLLHVGTIFAYAFYSLVLFIPNLLIKFIYKIQNMPTFAKLDSEIHSKDEKRPVKKFIEGCVHATDKHTMLYSSCMGTN